MLNENEYNTQPRYEAPVQAKAPDNFSPIFPKHPANKSRVFQRDHRHRNNTGWCTDVLFGNSRTLNEPVCFVRTYDVQEKQKEWWPRPPFGVSEPEHTSARATLPSRLPSLPEGKMDGPRNTRHGSNPEMRRYAVGVVPTNDLWNPDNSVRVSRERLSYEHVFDARGSLDGYPARGNRQGAFVLQPVPLSSLDGTHVPTSKVNETAKLPAVDGLRQDGAVGYDKDLVVRQEEHRRPLVDVAGLTMKTDISQYYVP